MDELVSVNNEQSITARLKNDEIAQAKIDKAILLARDTCMARVALEEEGHIDLNFMSWWLRDIAEALFEFEDINKAMYSVMDALEEIKYHMTRKELEAFYTLSSMARDFIFTFFVIPSFREYKHNADKKVYIFLFDNNNVKIGVAIDEEKRKSALEHSSGSAVVKWCSTAPMNTKKAFAIENACHKHFKDKRLKGEFFKITFDEAYTELQKHADIVQRYE